MRFPVRLAETYVTLKGSLLAEFAHNFKVLKESKQPFQVHLDMEGIDGKSNIYTYLRIIMSVLRRALSIEEIDKCVKLTNMDLAKLNNEHVESIWHSLVRGEMLKEIVGGEDQEMVLDADPKIEQNTQCRRSIKFTPYIIVKTAVLDVTREDTAAKMLLFIEEIRKVLCGKQVGKDYNEIIIDLSGILYISDAYINLICNTFNQYMPGQVAKVVKFINVPARTLSVNLIHDEVKGWHFYYHFEDDRAADKYV
jgi:hypothetical protein